jgi:hypothetical protein
MYIYTIIITSLLIKYNYYYVINLQEKPLKIFLGLKYKLILVNI